MTFENIKTFEEYGEDCEIEGCSGTYIDHENGALICHCCGDEGAIG